MRSVRTGWVLGALLLVSAQASRAGTGAPALHSKSPARITLVGSTAGVPDAIGTFTVTAIDLANNPMRNVSVIIDLSGCPDVAICADPLDAAAMVNCVAKMVRKFTDSAGNVSFTVLGAGSGTGDFIALPHSAKIYVNGSLIGSPTAAVLDLDGMNGVGINDLAVWLQDFGADPPRGRSDFDGDGVVDINDLSVWIQAFGAHGSLQGCAARCP